MRNTGANLVSTPVKRMQSIELGTSKLPFESKRSHQVKDNNMTSPVKQPTGVKTRRVSIHMNLEKFTEEEAIGKFRAQARR